MHVVNIDTDSKYDVLIGGGLLAESGKLIADTLGLGGGTKILLVTDDIVDGLYGQAAVESLEGSGFDVVRHVFPNGEASKNMTTLASILECAAANRLTRTDLIVALGGGVVGDIAGMAAAIYLRGVRYVQIPTTFLAAIDSSVGGKTAVDLEAGKNLAGAFWQPSLVICDTDTLSTLSEDTFSDGTAEAIKYGMIYDAALFERLMNGNFSDDIDSIIARCVEIKETYVSEDEKDTGIRQILNFGHTIGHAIEKCSKYEISHGKAVAIGMYIISNAAERLGYAETGISERLKRALVSNCLPTTTNYNLDNLYEGATGDKKRRGDRLSLVLVDKIGHSLLHEVDMQGLKNFIRVGLGG